MDVALHIRNDPFQALAGFQKLLLRVTVREANGLLFYGHQALLRKTAGPLTPHSHPNCKNDSTALLYTFIP